MVAKRSLRQFSYEVDLRSQANGIVNRKMKPTRVQSAIKILKASAEEFDLLEKPKARKSVKSTTTKKAAKKPKR